MVLNTQMKILQRRAKFLEDRISEESEDDDHGYDKAELSAIRAVVQYVDDEERNLIYKRVSQRAYTNGQKSIMEFYKRTLKKAIHSNNVDVLQFLLDRTTEWLKEINDGKNPAEERQDI